MVAATIRTILAQPDADHVREQLDTIALMRGGRRHGPRAAQIDPSACDPSPTLITLSSCCAYPFAPSAVSS
jgi:hypothetical protein